MKRHVIFQEFKKSKIDIACIQESFVTDDILQEVEKQWGGQVIYSPGTNKSLGTMILLNRNFNYSDLKVLSKSK